MFARFAPGALDDFTCWAQLAKSRQQIAAIKNDAVFIGEKKVVGLPDEAQFGIFAYPMASRKNECPTAVPRARDHASAFDLFLRWAPRAQPPRVDTRPSFEVTWQIGP